MDSKTRHRLIRAAALYNMDSPGQSGVSERHPLVTANAQPAIINLWDEVRSQADRKRDEPMPGGIANDP